jgi:hypothetical protein
VRPRQEIRQSGQNGNVAGADWDVRRLDCQ